MHIVDMGGASIDTRSAMGRMFFTMTAAFAEMERNMTSERTRETIAYLRKDGQVYTRIPPLGFDHPHQGKRKRKGDKLVPNAAEQAVVAKIRRMRKTGLSINKIADQLNATKAKTKRGGKWYACTVQKILRRAA
jgi:DNA invertase Pin-like site-specific DNA recombinase